MKSLGISPLVDNVGEVILDQFISDNYALLKDIPVFNTVLSTVSLCKNVSDAIFSKKLESFLKHMASVEPDTKKKIKDFAKNSSADKVSEMLITVIDNSLSHDKPEILAAVFLGLVDGKISVDDFKAVVESIDRAYTPELVSFLSTTVDIVNKDINSLKRMSISNLIYSPLLIRVEKTRLLCLSHKSSIQKTVMLIKLDKF